MASISSRVMERSKGIKNDVEEGKRKLPMADQAFKY
jgi:hypothetical protein